MRIKIGTMTFDTDIHPIQLELTGDEKTLISNMADTDYKFAVFPESWDNTTPQQRLDWMKFNRDPSLVYTYFDRKASKVAVRSDIDNLTCLHYLDGKHEVDALYLQTNCYLIVAEPKTNGLLYSSFMLKQSIRYKNIVYLPCESGDDELIELRVGFGRNYKRVTTLITEQDHQAHGEMLEWIRIHSKLALDTFKSVVPGA